ncbi:hypothetical protein D3C72_2237560 [compost metagenome]
MLLNLDPGVVEGVVQPAVGGHQALMQLAHLGVAGHVASNEQRFAACRVDLRHGGLAADRVEVDHYHFHALVGERQGGCPADAGTRAGHQGYLARKGHAHRVLL